MRLGLNPIRRLSYQVCNFIGLTFVERSDGTRSGPRGRPSSQSLRFGKGKHNLTRSVLALLTGNQTRAVAGKFAAKDPGDIEYGPASADHADVVRAIADNIALCTQNGVLEWYSIRRRCSSNQHGVTCATCYL
jgi:hypothetical protein